jgi:hypothetical protein
VKEIDILPIKGMFSLRRLAEFFDCFDTSGRPCTETIREWWHSGKLPPPDVRISKKAIYWKPETIEIFVQNGGV